MRRELEKAALGRLLDLCAETQDQKALIVRSVSSSSVARRRLKARRRELIRALGSVSAHSRNLPSWLSDLRRRHRLDQVETVLLVILLHHRLVGGDAGLSGRELLSFVCDTASELVDLVALLRHDGRLLKSRLVESAGRSGDALLDAVFRVAPRVYRKACSTLMPVRRRRPKTVRPGRPYRSNVEHVLDLRRLVELHARRAAVVFPQSIWVDLIGDVREGAEDLARDIEDLRSVIASREAGTAGIFELPIVSLRREFQLEPDEEISLLALVFQELYSAAPFLHLAEILRLVSGSEADLLRKRHLLAPAGRLAASGLIAFEDELADKALLATACVPDRVVDRLLEPSGAQDPIGSAERERFRAWLKELEGSEEFFKRIQRKR